MEKINKLLVLFSLLIASIAINAQSTYSFSVGRSIPDNISNYYLKTGLTFTYGIDIKLYKNLFLSTGLSLSFNNKNPDYNFGVDEEPLLSEDPILKEIYSGLLLSDKEIFKMYLLNASIDLNVKYSFLNEKKFSSYFSVGINGNYSFYEDPLFHFYYNSDGQISGSSTSGGLQQLFNIGYNTAVGVKYRAIFFELNYRMLPKVKFGKFEDPTGLFILKVGIDLPFSK